jgi:ectoine hydroxylase-related dioxygenase (phytanoyl-CoA dioxygenase family)
LDQEHLVHRRKINPNESQKLFGLHPKHFPGNVPLPCQPGDIVMFNHDTWHAAYGGSNRRRMFTMNCHRHANTAAEFQALKEWLDLHAFGNGARFAQAPAKLFTDTMLNTASPERMKHLEQPLRTYAGLYAQYAQKAKAAVAVGAVG